MQDRLPFFAELEASQRASLALVVQTAVATTVEWMTDPHSNVNYTARAFELMPQDLTRRMPLRHSVDMLRVTMEFFEEVAPVLTRDEEQLTALTVGIMKYSRDLAFSAATAYADAAEARGSWDSRMEATSSAPWCAATPALSCCPGPRPELGHQRAGDGRGGDAGAGPGKPCQPGRSRYRHPSRSRRAHRRARHLSGGHRVWAADSDREGVRGATGCLLRRPGGDRTHCADADRGLPQRQRGDFGNECGNRLARRAAARAGARTTARAGADGRPGGHRGIAHRRDATAG